MRTHAATAIDKETRHSTYLVLHRSILMRGDTVFVLLHRTPTQAPRFDEVSIVVF